MDWQMSPVVEPVETTVKQAGSVHVDSADEFLKKVVGVVSGSI